MNELSLTAVLFWLGNVLKIGSSTPKIGIECEPHGNSQTWKCSCNKKGLGFYVDNLPGMMLVCSSDLNLEFIKIPSIPVIQETKSVSGVSRSDSAVIKKTKSGPPAPRPTSHSAQSKVYNDHESNVEGTNVNDVRHIMETTPNILFPMHHKKYGYASEIARESMHCLVFDRDLKPGETMRVRGCTYICDKGVFRKRDCNSRKTEILLTGTKGKFRGK